MFTAIRRSIHSALSTIQSRLAPAQKEDPEMVRLREYRDLLRRYRDHHHEAVLCYESILKESLDPEIIDMAYANMKCAELEYHFVLKQIRGGIQSESDCTA